MLASSVTVQPLGMQAPPVTYLIFYILFVVQLVPAVIWMLHSARSRRSRLPVAMLAGAVVVGFFSPPVLNSMTNVWFPSNIPGTYIVAFNMHDPFFDWMGYTLFFGLGGYITFLAIERGVGMRGMWITAALWGVTDLIYELPFLNASMYTYYGDQPFEILGFPAYWLVVNSMVPVLAGTLVHAAVRSRWGAEHGIALPMVALAATAIVVVGAVTPVSVFLHAEVPSVVRMVGALLSIAIGLAVIRTSGLYARSVQTARRAAQPVEERSAPVADAR